MLTWLLVAKRGSRFEKKSLILTTEEGVKRGEVVNEGKVVRIVESTYVTWFFLLSSGREEGAGIDERGTNEVVVVINGVWVDYIT